MEQKRILVVDDDPDMVAAVEAVLKGESYNVVTASDGEEGLRKVVEERPDLRLEKCSVCSRLMQDGAYVGNKGKLVCHVVKGTKEDCYKASYEQEIEVEV